MWNDPVVEEVRNVRRKIQSEYKNNGHAIATAIKDETTLLRQQGWKVVGTEEMLKKPATAAKKSRSLVHA